MYKFQSLFDSCNLKQNYQMVKLQETLNQVNAAKHNQMKKLVSKT